MSEDEAARAAKQFLSDLYDTALLVRPDYQAEVLLAGIIRAGGLPAKAERPQCEGWCSNCGKHPA